jgi:hypothetical protein
VETEYIKNSEKFLNFAMSSATVGNSIGPSRERLRGSGQGASSQPWTRCLEDIFFFRRVRETVNKPSTFFIKETHTCDPIESLQRSIHVHILQLNNTCIKVLSQVLHIISNMSTTWVVQIGHDTYHVKDEGYDSCKCKTDPLGTIE